MTRRALVLWVDPTSRNLGVQALAHGALAVLDHAGYDAECQSFAVGPSPIQPTLRAVLPELIRPGALASFFSDYDLVVDMAGGDSFTSLYGWKRLAHIATTRRVVVGTGVTTVLGPQTVGPFDSAWSRALARWSLRGVDLIVARDSMSERFVEATMGLRAELATDLVFALPAPASDTLEFDVLLNPSGLLWLGTVAGISAGAYRRALVEVVERVRAQGRQVALLAHVMSNETDDDDTKACEGLASLVGGAQILRPASVTEVRAQAASAALVIGSRMHACLNALSVGTPVIAWSYSRKFEGLLGDLRWPHVLSLVSGSIAMTAAHTARLVTEATASRDLAKSTAVVARSNLAELATRLGSL